MLKNAIVFYCNTFIDSSLLGQKFLRPRVLIQKRQFKAIVTSQVKNSITTIP